MVGKVVEGFINIFDGLIAFCLFSVRWVVGQVQTDCRECPRTYNSVDSSRSSVSLESQDYAQRYYCSAALVAIILSLWSVGWLLSLSSVYIREYPIPRNWRIDWCGYMHDADACRCSCNFRLFLYTAIISVISQ